MPPISSTKFGYAKVWSSFKKCLEDSPDPIKSLVRANPGYSWDDPCDIPFILGRVNHQDRHPFRKTEDLRFFINVTIRLEMKSQSF